MSITQEGNLLSFPINIAKTIKHLRKDMVDDWFYDTVGYEDLLSNPSSLFKILQKNLETNHGLYQSGSKTIYDVPKNPLGLRYTLEIDFYDRFIYQAICTFLVPFFDPLLSPSVLSHRYDKHGDKGLLFRNPIDMWDTFQNISHSAIVDGQCLLITDLLNYFEHISIASVENAFIGMMSKIEASGGEKNTIRSAITTLKALLEKWCFNEHHGLPQNRDASSFIANVVLDSVDKRMKAAGYDYWRYVDDIRITCANDAEAKRALNAWLFRVLCG